MMTHEHSDTIAELVQDLLQQKDGVKRLLEELLSAAMRAEVSEQLGAERHERKPRRQGWRNGVKPRKLKTRVGELELRVPQVRNSEPYHPSMLARWQRSERALLVACSEMYFQGVSTRRVQQVLDEMCGCDVSAMTVSRVAAELDEKLAEFRGRRLDQHEYPCLMIAARYEKVPRQAGILSEAVLVVSGFNEQGQREISDWRNGASESEAAWGELFRQLKERGLSGVRLVVSDAHAGIVAALAALPGAFQTGGGAQGGPPGVPRGVERVGRGVCWRRETGVLAARRRDGPKVGDPAAESGGDVAGRTRGLPDGAGFSGEPSPPSGIDEHAGAADEDAEATHASGGGVSQPGLVREADRGDFAGAAREVATGAAALLQHGERRSGGAGAGGPASSLRTPPLSRDLRSPYGLPAARLSANRK